MRKKYTRDETKVRPVQIQARDMEILCNLASYRFLNTEQILALHHGGRRNLLRRLVLLYDTEYIDRPDVQRTTKLPSQHMVYSLGNEGAHMVMDNRDRIVWNSRNAKISAPNLAHALMVSQFRATLDCAVRERNGEIIRWVQGYNLKDLLTIRGRRPSTVPDGFFSFRIGDTQWHIFLEADRGTMTHHRVLDKYKKYWEWFTSKRYNDHLGMTRFRVLTVTPSIARRDNLCITAKGADPRRHGSGLFLFASETDFSLPNPQSIFGDMWVCPKDQDKYRIIE